jgi:mono/diheme cytochrome c family protein
MQELYPRNAAALAGHGVLVAATFLSSCVFGASNPVLDRQFAQNVRPLVTKYCVGCHSGNTPAAQFDLKAYDTMAPVVRDYPRWALVLDRLIANEMPPKQAPQLPAEARKLVIDWIQAVRGEEIRRNSGDPGPVLARRLSNAEYNYTVRDLTGVDLRPAREFPVDPANQAGFDNSGESLTVSPALISKYLEAARQTAYHLVLTPDGLAFAPYPMLVETDREKYAIQRIVDFYQRQPTNFADYFQAAWRYKHRAVLGQPQMGLAGIAAESQVSPRYLAMVWQILEQTKEEVGPLVKLQTMWRKLPTPKANQADIAGDDVVGEGCVRMGDFVARIRRHTEKLFNTPVVPGMGANFEPFVVWRDREIAAHRRDFDPAALLVEGEPPPAEIVVTRGPTFGNQEQIAVKKAIAEYIKDRQEDPDLVVPAGERARYEAAFARFSFVFPTGFCLRERGRFYPIDTIDQGRYLGAGFHNVMGYFRDDTTLSELILDEKGKKELDRLWQDFDFIADYTVRTWQQFIFNGGGGPRGVSVERPSFKAATTQPVIFNMRDQYLKAAPADNPAVTQAIKVHFESVNSEIRWVERARLEAEPRHLDALLSFAARAYRRPLSKDERDEILAYYHELRAKSNLTHEEAMRGSITSLLVSPGFLYRVDLVDGGRKRTNATAAVRTLPLSGYALANRLSYFLWSSMPDGELLAHAAAGDLERPAVLVAQVRRMLRDERARGLATEFAGNWLDFRHFENHNAVDRERFPAFNDQLREAMFQEPIRFFGDVIRNDRSVLNFLYGNHTFVNRVLAEHYGMPSVTGGSVTGGKDEWVRVDDARSYGRGGLLPMAVFLTQNAPGLRTSPVKRGYWVARRVLGEVIPPPPPVVPELPHDESKSDLPVRDMLAKHRENRVCASCHARFDSFGLALEGYGPVGEKRTKDLAGRLVDTHAAFPGENQPGENQPGGEQGTGLEGLQSYIHAHREKDFLNNLSQKMLVYALGRSPLLSDEPLLEGMRTRLAGSGYRISALVETIVTSPQFLNRRNPEYYQKRGD